MLLPKPFGLLRKIKQMQRYLDRNPCIKNGKT